MKRKQIITLLENQVTFKKAVLEMLNHEIGAINREIAMHKQLIEQGDEDIPEEQIYQDVQKKDNILN